LTFNKIKLKFSYYSDESHALLLIWSILGAIFVLNEDTLRIRGVLVLVQKKIYKSNFEVVHANDNTKIIHYTYTPMPYIIFSDF